MTISFKTYSDMKRFCGKMFTGDTKDNVLPVFSNCNLSFNFKQAQVDCDKTLEELQTWLSYYKINVNYVSEF